jgi:hypothetical protein
MNIFGSDPGAAPPRHSCAPLFPCKTLGVQSLRVGAILPRDQQLGNDAPASVVIRCIGGDALLA